MDLLGSILDKMDKPPIPSSNQKKSSNGKSALHKQQEAERKKKVEFRTKTEDKIQTFVCDPIQTRLKFPPMDKLWRSIIHDVAEVASLVSFSFGEEDYDKYVMVFKTQPCEEELQALRSGEEYDPSQNLSKEEETEQASVHEDKSEEDYARIRRKSKEKFVPASAHYQDKYKHIIGTETGLEAARKAEPNVKFGMVPSERKRDVRSIEETMNAMRAKKKKMSSEPQTQKDS